MKYKLYTEVALAVDKPADNLKKGDVVTIVDFHPGSKDEGYSIEIFNAIGETIGVSVVKESEIVPLMRDEIFNVRSLYKDSI